MFIYFSTFEYLCTNKTFQAYSHHESHVILRIKYFGIKSYDMAVYIISSRLSASLGTFKMLSPGSPVLTAQRSAELWLMTSGTMIQLIEYVTLTSSWIRMYATIRDVCNICNHGSDCTGFIIVNPRPVLVIWGVSLRAVQIMLTQLGYDLFMEIKSFILDWTSPWKGGENLVLGFWILNLVRLNLEYYPQFCGTHIHHIIHDLQQHAILQYTRARRT